jgi:hypothetical protein
MRRRFTVAERRARIGIRHRLAAGTGADSVAEAAASLVVLHATDAPSCFLQARARMRESSPEAIEHEMYDAPTVLRLLAMRRTLFLVPLEDVPVVYAAASRAVAETERRRTIGMMEGAGIGPDPAALLAELETVGLAAVRVRGAASTAELTRIDPRLGQKIVTSVGKRYQGSLSLSSKVFFHLALDGRIGRWRPRGSWISGQFRWSPIERWFPSGIPERPVDEARVELVRRWLRTFGPGTLSDIRWWTGWTVGATRAALAASGAVEVDLEGGGVGYVLAGDLEPTHAPDPWVALLPALDATTMGWTDRDWYLGPHRRALFDTAGNAGPTVWVDGRIVGGWVQRRTGEVVSWLLEDVGTEAKLAIDAEAARVQAWIGETRVRSTFPTPDGAAEPLS